MVTLAWGQGAEHALPGKKWIKNSKWMKAEHNTPIQSH